MKFYLFCKSYRNDLLRLRRLVESVDRFNADKLSFVVSVPPEDLETFRKMVPSANVDWIDDISILHSNVQLRNINHEGIDGRIIQQVVKAEFWRWAGCDSYLCLDSDSIFLKSFRLTDFLDGGGTPFSTLHQNKEYLQLACNMRKNKVVDDFYKSSSKGRSIFKRIGPDYDFGPTPVVWSAKVWDDLDNKFLKPRKWHILDAINYFSEELRWYGEALLEYRSIDILPIEPHFRVYHKRWQNQALRRKGEDSCTVMRNYLGVVVQSNWDFDLDPPSTDNLSLARFVRKIRRRLSGNY